MKFLALSCSAFLAVCFQFSHAQTFTDVTPVDFSTLPLAGSAQWGDFDNDGKMELMYMGTSAGHTEGRMVVFKNDGATFQIVFTSSTLGVIPSASSTDNFDIADLDNDGDLDIVGYGKGIRIIRNNSHFSFEDSGLTLYWPDEAAGFGSSVYGGDQDRDGQMDLLMTGRYVWGTFLNNNFKFDKQLSLADELGLGFNYQRWADMDQDGDLDILVSRNDGVDYRNFLMIQQHDGSFSRNLQNVSNLYWRNLEFADFDVDGDLDVLAQDGPDHYSIFINDNMYLVEGNVTFASVHSAKCADFNNDGFADILLTGTDTKIYYNNHNGTFTDSGITSLPAFSQGTVSVGDYDGDGDADISLVGENAGRIFRNEWIETGNPAVGLPSIPTPVSAVTTYNSVLFQWTPGAGPAISGQTYNLLVRSEDESLVMPSHLATDEITSTLYAEGNVQGTTHYQLQGLADGTYQWSVQALNGSFRASEFSPVGTFTIQGTNPDSPGNFAAAPISETSIKLTWTDRCTFESDYRIYQKEDTPYSDYSNYWLAAANDTSITITHLEPETRYVYKIVALGCTEEYENPTEISAKTFPPIFKKVTNLLPEVVMEGTALVLGDYDNDRDLDLLASFTVDGVSTNVLFKYEYDKYVDTGIHFPFVVDMNSSAQWIDYDNDGYLDLFFHYGALFKLYLNKKTSFVESPVDITLDISFAVRKNGISFADIDNDSNLDMLVAGTSFFNDPTKSNIQLYINVGKNKFINSGVNFGNAFLITSADPWIDYNNDGYKDILVSRRTASCGSMTILKNVNGKSLEVQEIGVDFGLDIIEGSSDYKIADYNNDGLLDFAMSGISQCGATGFTRIYRNTGISTFTLVPASMVGRESNVCLAWADINNDGYTDLCSYGYPSTGIDNMRVYWNSPDGTITDSQSLLSRSFDNGSIVLGDLDNDNDLDCVSFGSRAADNKQVIEIFKNGYADGWGVGNQPPSAPTHLVAEVVYRGMVQLRWDESTDDKAKRGLSYNLYLINGSDTVIQANSLGDGRRKVVGIGNVHNTKLINMNYLLPGKYRWAVQAIDQSYVGSAFSQQGSFELTGEEPLPPVTGLKSDPTSEIRIFPNPIEDELNIQTPSAVNIRVWDMTGQEILSTTIEYDTKLQVRDWRPGIYLIEYKSDKIGIKRFIKK